MKIAICDDDPSELKNVKNVANNFIISKHPKHNITLDVFTNGMDLLDFAEKYGGFDLLILDILMPEINGIELAAEIRKKDERCKIIFLTTSPEFAVSSYRVNAFFYLLKPFTDTELDALLNKVLSQMDEEESSSIVIKNNGKLTRVKIHTIHYIECIRHTIIFHLHHGEVLSCYGTISEYSKILSTDKRFVKCHKSFIINMDYVISITSKDFVLTDKTAIPISRQVLGMVKNAYIEHFFKKENGVLI